MPSTHDSRLAARSPVTDKLQTLAGLSRPGLEAVVHALGEKPFRVRQFMRWIYQQGATDFAVMSNLSSALRARLGAHYTLARPEIASALHSVDGTQKWLLRFADGQEAETVFIPDRGRGTLCISSQIGCTLNCRFCLTGTQKLVRNLTAQEIVAQVLVACDQLGEWPRRGETRRITNIVFMGMGEPLYNTDQLVEALGVLTDPEGIAISKRRITVSTSGIVPELARIGAETGAALAISLHATTDLLRNELVPINRKYPLSMLLEAVRSYPGLDNSNRVTWEYVMLDGVNDRMADAERLLKLIAGIPSKINLIPFNPWPNSPYRCSKPEAIRSFADRIFKAGYAAPVRQPRGRDIMAACGQLKSSSIPLRASMRFDSPHPARQL
ncbi:MAG: 23S rRNA (adenine(2503)-C(2))-methyltransferase RlmN [Pseudomonadota bacterium]